MHRTFRVAALALTLLPLAATSAQADTLTLSSSADPVEDAPALITATWSSNESGLYVVVTRKFGSQSCASTAAADVPNSRVVMNRLVGASGSTSTRWTVTDPGTLTLCGYLQRVSDRAVMAAAGPVAMTYRAARSSVTLEVPPRVVPGQSFRVVAPLSAELRRHLAVTLKATGSRDCAASYALDEPFSDDVMSFYTQGVHRYTKPIKAPAVNGLYLLCAYLSERPGDAAPEASFRATFEVGPDLCAEARSKLTDANRAARAAQSSMTKHRRSMRRHERRAQRTHGASRAAHRRQARRARNRYEQAVRRRDAARSAAATAQTEVTAACGGR